MRKINLYYLFLSSFLFLGFLTPLHAQKNTDELFKKVFGVSGKEEKKTLVDVTLGDFFLGEISVSLVGEKVTKVSISDLKLLLTDKIREESLLKYKMGEGDVEPSSLPFKVSYHADELRIAIIIPIEDLKPSNANVYDELTPYYSRQANKPSPFSAGLNYKLEQSFNKHTNQKNNFLAQTNAFVAIKKVSIENQMTYISNRNSHWGRQSTRAIYDLPSYMQRIEAGDVSYPVIGYQQGVSLGGLSFYRDFALNPYRMVTPTSSFEYLLDNHSLVKTHVNNVLLKTEYMNAGRYSVKDIPLNNGINKIKVEVTDDFGVTKVLSFNESGSLDLLSEGLSKYSLAGGYPKNEVDGNIKYEQKKGAFLTGFYQYGIQRHWTMSVYAQGDKKYSLAGTNHVLASRFGNLSYDLAGSKNELHEGFVSQLIYQLNMFGAFWYDSHTLTAKVEYRSSFFNETGALFENRFNTTTTVSYSIPLFERFNIALSGTYQNPTLADNARLAYNGSLTTNLLESSSLTLYAGRNRNEFKSWSNQIYIFFNMTFGKSSTFLSTFYDHESDTKRLTLIRDSGKKYNDVKIAASVVDNKSAQNGILDLQYNSVLADVGAKEELIKLNGRELGVKTSMRLLSSFAYVNNGSDSAFSISRPISNSFVIFKPNDDWKGQKFGVQTSNGVNDSSTGIFGETLVSDLTPYQYRRLQLDPSNLDPGYILGQESFVVYPRKNSGHLFVIGKSGRLVLHGKIIDNKNKPMDLKVGFWTSSTGHSTPFFTNREGDFFIEGIEANSGTIQVDDDNYAPFKIDLSGRKQGMVEVGNIILPQGESK